MKPGKPTAAEHAIMIVDWYRASCLCGWESDPKQSRGAAATSGAMHRSHCDRKAGRAALKESTDG